MKTSILLLKFNPIIRNSYYSEHRLSEQGLVMNRNIILLGLLVLTTCSATHPVHGVQDNGVQFLGSATGYLNGDGDIDMTMDDGRHCAGTYHWTGNSSAATANGTFHCDDGMTGSFASEGSAASSSGFGRTSDGHKFKFYTGQAAQINIGQ